MSRRRAFSLVEAMVATALLAVVILSVGALFLHGLQIRARSEEIVRATNILRHEAESMRTRPWKKTGPATALIGLRELAGAQPADSEPATLEGGKWVSFNEATRDPSLLGVEAVSSFTPYYDYHNTAARPAATGLVDAFATRRVKLTRATAGSTVADRAEVLLKLEWGPPGHRRERTSELIINRDGLLATR